MIFLLGIIIALLAFQIPSRIVYANNVETSLKTQEWDTYKAKKFTCDSLEDLKQYSQCLIIEKWSNSHWKAFELILERESGWDHTAANPTSSARGLCQTMMSVHETDSDFLTNPRKQIRWCINYTEKRYGTPNIALAFWNENHYW